MKHLESMLGPATRGWDHDAAGNPVTVALAEFLGPFPGATTISTIGLSRYLLKQSGHPHTEIRQELLWGAWARFSTRDACSRLEDLAELAIRRETAFQRGECRDFGDPIIPGTKLTGLYFAIPVYYPKRLAMVTGVYAEPLAFVWVLPVSGAEVQYGLANGWGALEDIFVQRDPDLFDLDRPSVV